MRSFVYGVVAAASLLVAVPAFAQVRLHVGEEGLGVRLGDRDHGRDRDHNRFRVPEHRNCETIWRHGHRVTVCRR